MSIICFMRNRWRVSALHMVVGMIVLAALVIIQSCSKKSELSTAQPELVLQTGYEGGVGKDVIERMTENDVRSIFSPEGISLASASESGKVLLWNLKSGSLMRELEGYSMFYTIAFSAAVNSVAFSRDGALASGGYVIAKESSEVNLWDRT